LLRRAGVLSRSICCPTWTLILRFRNCQSIAHGGDYRCPPTGDGTAAWHDWTSGKRQMSQRR
jgi:hypothetical protein